MRQAYITEQNISFLAGWETGRQSEPMFMNMNLRVACGCSLPKVVLYQMDNENPMNPHSILVAYAEDDVKPVVSDFDTFLVGSTNMSYETLEKTQQDLALWTLDETEKILEANSGSGGNCSWSKSWMTVLQSKTGPDLAMPEYGFGDATSCWLIKAIAAATRKTGAVRHGAECFNYSFPQELDDEYLIVWEGFQMLPGCQRDPPWKYMKMDDLHHFLFERIAEGYSFPLNPVWPVRDEGGWFEVHMQLMRSEASKGPCDAWYPQGSGIREKIAKIHERFPRGFQHAQSHTGISCSSRIENRSYSIEDVDAREHADVLQFKFRPSGLWSRARSKVMSFESIMQIFTQRAPLRQSVASSASGLSTRRGTVTTICEDLVDCQNSNTLLNQNSFEEENSISQHSAEDQSSASQHSAEDDAMPPPAPPPRDAQTAPLAGKFRCRRFSARGSQVQ